MTEATLLTIGVVARESGFSPDTIRYYERLGLLAPPPRNAAGRRSYRARDVERLRFVARAKALGCTLDEIGRLAAVYDDDCGTVQAELRGLVEAKSAETRERITELLALDGQLVQARSTLDGPAVSGGCEPACACSVATAEPAATPSIVCTLEPDEMQDRGREWRTMLAGVTGRAPVDGGLRLAFGPETNVGDLARLVEAEQGCCSFFGFALTFDARGVALEVRAPVEARGLVDELFGA